MVVKRGSGILSIQFQNEVFDALFMCAKSCLSLTLMASSKVIFSQEKQGGLRCEGKTCSGRVSPES